MSQAFGFDFNGIQEEENVYGVIKPGKYEARIDEAAIKPTKSGGFYVSLKLRIEGPTSKNRVHYDNINIKNASKQAEDIGKGRLKAVMLCLGYNVAEMASKTPADLVNKKIVINLGLDNNDESRNKVFSYEAFKEGQPMGGAESTAPVSDETKKAPSWF